MSNSINEYFNPEGSGYDYKTAIKYGISPDKYGKWQSREPESGRILKGRGHDTWDETVLGEEESGYEIYKGADGYYYSRKKKSSDPQITNEYFQPASTGVHNNIDNLILQAELDKLAQTGSMRADTRPQYIGGVDPIVENIALSPLLTLKSLGSVGKKLLEKTGLRNPVSHYTTGQGAANILDTGSIYGTGKFPGENLIGGARAVSVTRDPMFASRPHGSIGTDIRFVLDRDEMVKKGFTMQPFTARNYGKTMSYKNQPTETLMRLIENKTAKELKGLRMKNPRFEFEERVRGNIPTENIKLIDILQLPLGESDFSPNMLKLLGQLSRTNIPIIKSFEAKEGLQRTLNRLMNISRFRLGKGKPLSQYLKEQGIDTQDYIQATKDLMTTPTYRFDPFEKVR